MSFHLFLWWGKRLHKKYNKLSTDTILTYTPGKSLFEEREWRPSRQQSDGNRQSEKSLTKSTSFGKEGFISSKGPSSVNYLLTATSTRTGRVGLNLVYWEFPVRSRTREEPQSSVTVTWTQYRTEEEEVKTKEDKEKFPN